MIQLLASTRSKEYPIYLSVDSIDRIGSLWASQGDTGKVAAITDTNVGGLYLPQIERSFEEAGFTFTATEVDAGEGTKTLAQAAKLYSRLFELKIRRGDAVCALGGGVIGDLAGFVASTYMRGVRLIQVPTTLLAQVDSSIGGKTGVNIPEAKNYVGSFYQPDMVLTDPVFLKTLPPEQMAEGLAEVIKYALLSGEDFFDALETSYQSLLDLDMAFLETVVRRCIEYKLAVVAEDERDYGRRAVLNLGHSVGHGIEAAGNYRLYSHGQAVALGLLAAVRLSEKIFSLPPEYGESLASLHKLLGLPTVLKGVEPRAVMESMAADKKADGISANMVLLRKIGDPVINCDVDAGLLASEVERLASGASAGSWTI
ncbi:MAG: 3-dehydroquinate synthase [Thermoleophilia bacterium]|nr:3-dehydroquinate synthase [Thermoleophilia bacterium]